MGDTIGCDARVAVVGARVREMDNAFGFLTTALTWFSAQSTPVQVIVVVGIVAALYPVLVIVRLIVTALYGAFRGLG